MKRPFNFNPCKTMSLPDDIRLDGGVDWEKLPEQMRDAAAEPTKGHTNEEVGRTHVAAHRKTR